ncbi:MAG: TetR/AcrR family transcriptional regulator [Streptosporangiaceae bacterium]|nr:TetR/AcrR family transcriptional regulator [Streptosporangiaceae bacterium]
MRERGLVAATTAEIVREAGVAEGSIYYHFPDKTSLIMAVMVEGPPASLREATATLREQIGTGSIRDNLAQLAGQRSPSTSRCSRWKPQRSLISSGWPPCAASSPSAPAGQRGLIKRSPATSPPSAPPAASAGPPNPKRSRPCSWGPVANTPA